MLRPSLFLSVVLLSCAICLAEPARLLMVSQSAGYRHSSVHRKDAPLSPAERAITELGVASGLFRVDCTQNVDQDFTKEKLQHYELVLFFTSGT